MWPAQAKVDEVVEANTRFEWESRIRDGAGSPPTFGPLHQNTIDKSLSENH